MDGVSRPPAKLQKRKSRERNDTTDAHMSGALNLPSANSSQPMSSHNMSASEKERRSKWRLANPFHSKEKDKDRPTDRKDSEFTGDSAYASSEPSSSANPSFASNPRPVSGEQWHPTPVPFQAASQAPSQPPTTSLTAPTPPTNGSYSAQPPQPLYSSQENVFKETHQDNRTGNIVTTVTTTTTTTTTTTGPGGTTVVQQPAGADPSRASITSTSGPSPPSPASPALASYMQGPGHHQHGAGHHQQGVDRQQDSGYHQGLSHQPSVISNYSRNPEHEPHISIPGDSVPPMPTHHYQNQNLAPQVPDVESSSPPLPTKSNIRNRVELDSVSPGIERPNPMVDPVSPITPGSPSRANFSYPARAPPQGVPRHVPSQHFPAQQQPSDPSRSYADPNYSTAARVPVGQGEYQKQSTLANLKLAAAGIHGAGEALRGTFNDTFDRRYAGVDSAAHAKNMATIQAGRAEIEAAQFPHRTRPSLEVTPPAQPQPLNTKTQYQGPPVSGSQIEGKSGKLNYLMRKMKDGSTA